MYPPSCMPFILASLVVTPSPLSCLVIVAQVGCCSALDGWCLATHNPAHPFTTPDTCTSCRRQAAGDHLPCGLYRAPND